MPTIRREACDGSLSGGSLGSRYIQLYTAARKFFVNGISVSATGTRAADGSIAAAVVRFNDDDDDHED